MWFKASVWTFEMVEMTDTELEAVMTAVTLAKDLQIRNAKSLRSEMIKAGFTAAEAGRALVIWGDYERSKRV